MIGIVMPTNASHPPLPSATRLGPVEQKKNKCSTSITQTCSQSHVSLFSCVLDAVAWLEGLE